MTNDAKRPLKPANENPWYLLATLYGELGNGRWPDTKLVDRNRRAWNRWAAKAILTSSELENLRAWGTEPDEPFSASDYEDFVRDYKNRANDPNAIPPDPHQLIDFSGTDFGRHASFKKYLFPSCTRFSRSAFRNDVDFSNAIFRGTPAGDNAVSFFKVNFIGNASFASAKFLKKSDFKNAKFQGRLLFSSAAFADFADFTNAEYLDVCSFQRARFLSSSCFRKANFSSDAVFTKALFNEQCDFVGCDFKSPAFFDEVRFHRCAPDFRDASLCEATVWHDTVWPACPIDRPTALQQVYAYERLKAEMERLKKHADEQYFFAKELRARRQLEKRLSARWILNWAYEIFGGFGQSIEWPLFWLVACFAIGADMLALIPTTRSASLDYHVAEGLSLSNIFSILPYKPDNSITEHLSTFAKIVSDLQSVIGLILLFLLGLALRNRFRMK